MICSIFSLASKKTLLLWFVGTPLPFLETEVGRLRFFYILDFCCFVCPINLSQKRKWTFSNSRSSLFNANICSTSIYPLVTSLEPFRLYTWLLWLNWIHQAKIKTVTCFNTTLTLNLKQVVKLDQTCASFVMIGDAVLTLFFKFNHAKLIGEASRSSLSG